LYTYISQEIQQYAIYNYRPISLLPKFNNIFEKLLHDRLYCYLKAFSLLTKHQYGLRPNSSMALAVEGIYSNILANYDKGLHTCLLFIDCLTHWLQVYECVVLGNRGETKDISVDLLTA